MSYRQILSFFGLLNQLINIFNLLELNMLFHSDANNENVIMRFVRPTVGFHIRNVLYNFHAFSHAAKHGVLVVQPRLKIVINNLIIAIIHINVHCSHLLCMVYAVSRAVGFLLSWRSRNVGSLLRTNILN